jgi:hypothetical protein
MDYAAMDFWWKVAITLMNGGVWLYMYLVNRNRVTNGRIDQLETDLGRDIQQHSERISRLEQGAKGSPSHTDLRKIYERIAGVEGSISRIEGENTAQTRILNLVYESLIDRSKP